MIQLTQYLSNNVHDAMYSYLNRTPERRKDIPAQCLRCVTSRTLLRAWPLSVPNFKCAGWWFSNVCFFCIWDITSMNIYLVMGRFLGCWTKRYGTEPNGTEPNGTEPNGMKRNGTKRNGTKRNETKRNGTNRNGTERNRMERNETAHNAIAVLV